MKHFKESDFVCHCGCGLYNMKGTFLSKLEFAREKAATPFIVHSGSRCKKHNAAEGGKENSDHLTGEGADIEAISSFVRWRVVTSAISAGFRRIGIGKVFIHLGDNMENPNPRIWVY